VSKEAMMKPCILRKPPFLRTLAAVGAVGLALSGSMALAQTSPGDTAPAAANPSKTDSGDGATAAPNQSSVSGVVVQAPRPQVSPPIPADKKAAFDAEVAKEEAWRRYRQSTPPASEGTIGQAKDYPGLRSLLPGQDDTSEGN
jgi:hypothetical protein